MTKDEWYRQLFERLDNSKFRSSFHLKQKDIDYIHENESEEHLKNITNSFLKAIYSAERYEINTDKRIDTDLMELEGGQKLVRFYDPSGNLIEVRTPVNHN